MTPSIGCQCWTQVWKYSTHKSSSSAGTSTHTIGRPSVSSPQRWMSYTHAADGDNQSKISVSSSSTLIGTLSPHTLINMTCQHSPGFTTTNIDEPRPHPHIIFLPFLPFFSFYLIFLFYSFYFSLSVLFFLFCSFCFALSILFFLFYSCFIIFN